MAGEETMNTINRSSLVDVVHTTALFKKIKELYLSKASSVVFVLPDGTKIQGNQCTLVTIDDSALTVDFTDPSAVAHSFTLSQISSILRVRSRKYKFNFKA